MDKLSGQPILCYFPDEGRWCKLGEMPGVFSGKGEFFFFRGKLAVYSKALDSFQQWCQLTRPLICYNPYSNSSYGGSPERDCYKAWVLREIFAVNDDEIYAMVSERQAVDYRVRDVRSKERRKRISFIIKYKEESNSWEDVTSIEFLDARQDVCILAKEDFVYFIGGEERLVESHNGEALKCYTDVYRYSLCRNQWDKMADFLQPKMELSRVACNGRIFIAGGAILERGRSSRCQCEVYSETTNEWQFIASLNISPLLCPKLL